MVPPALSLVYIVTKSALGGTDFDMSRVDHPGLEYNPESGVYELFNEKYTVDVAAIPDLLRLGACFDPKIDPYGKVASFDIDKQKRALEALCRKVDITPMDNHLSLEEVSNKVKKIQTILK